MDIPAKIKELREAIQRQTAEAQAIQQNVQRMIGAIAILEEQQREAVPATESEA